MIPGQFRSLVMSFVVEVDEINDWEIRPAIADALHGAEFKNMFAYDL